MKEKGDLTELEAVQKVNAHSKYITKCVLSPDTRYFFFFFFFLVEFN